MAGFNTYRTKENMDLAACNSCLFFDVWHSPFFLSSWTTEESFFEHIPEEES